jgi:disulfide bond formation protein DsbB
MLNSLTARQGMAVLCVGSLGLLAYGAYLQHVVGLEPCPMCIVQRYALVLVALFAGLGAALRMRAAQVIALLLLMLSAGFGAFVAARQSWLQWYPPEVSACGRDFYGMIENFPLQRVIPMIFKGSGDCSVIDWTFLGGSIANWSFVCFVATAIAGAWLLARRLRAA